MRPATMTAQPSWTSSRRCRCCYQPATVWDYGFGLDVLGLTIEKISGQSLGKYLQTNLFTPLGMTDTGFSISA